MNSKRILLALLFVVSLSSPAFAKDKWKEKLEKDLKTKKVTLNFSQTPLGDVISFFGAITGMNFVLDEGAKLESEEVSLKLKDVSLIHGLKLAICGNPDIGYKLEHGLVIVSTKKRLKSFTVAKAPKGSTAEQIKKWDLLAKKMVTVNFRDTPLSDIAAFLKDISGESVTLHSAKLGKTKITVRAKKISMIHAMSFMAQANTMKLVWNGKNLEFKAK
ncbi:MAG: hypothetical protein P1V97_33105 [Planctomycetota bacterium]|nr:hypothetical protein [Planctomycetota bacterium]